MFDTMTITKVAGALCGALLILLLGKWAAEGMYHAQSHGEAAYVIEVADSGEDSAPVEEVNFDELMAVADVESGAKVFRKCSACHKLDGTNGTGPHLDGVVGREIASIGEFSYSGALTELPGDWTPEELSHFIENPRGYAPGTAMGFAGLKKPQDRADVIAYMQSVTN
ncbi:MULTISPECIES: c-type cytochrome [Roseobacteraceae]|jgi:cytochrome c|uniref:Cytochrome c-552 n=1 Tax=Pseudosulfitobacter pseudonitzschiae TaxID=1402135 RepID=A0A221K3W9_9RHOB|nr:MULTISPECIES: cytochrome c family protein [Roseobacteraceae]ASM73563.1 cytochrome c-552 [Pseudosulfitobacter pseudonitzschiae]|mmetsp:Transcript_12913/g.21054  ORF Transcript_12913/g.21054 Transcript_12913/m.21054 type:complete len:168 (-) Transcript_12913:2-505(-)|eukprot:m.215618 g.215618  ORF g.215618 m.215618 type:complete len:168 (-) comp27967_c0_seq1:44-547(-)